MKKPYLSVVIPAYNEELRLPNTLKKICAFLKEQKYTSEIIIVDDGSTDGTKDISLPIPSAPLTEIRLLNKKHRGKGAAIRAGTLNAQGDCILFTDADNSTPIEEINKLLPALQNFDLAIGSRHLPESDIKIKQPWYRRVISRLANRLIQHLLLPGIVDTQCGFKLLRKEAAQEILPRTTVNGWSFGMELLFIARTLGYSVKEVPVTWLDSPQSRLRPIRDAFQTLMELAKIRINGWRGRYK